MAKALLLHGARPAERLADGLAEHEMVAEDAHRLAGGDAHRRLAEATDDAGDQTLRRVAGIDDAGGEAERPDRGSDERLAAAARMLAPVAAADLVLNQPALGRRIGDAQQRFRENHQRQSLAGRQREFAQKVLKLADTAG